MVRSVSSSKKAKSSSDSAGVTGLINRIALPLFVVWTLFVWGGRLRNLAADSGGFAEASRWSLWGSLAFVSLAVLVGLTRLPKFPMLSVSSVAHRLSLLALVALTIGVWAVRAVDIALGDHSLAFIAVHVVLAVVSTGLGLLSAAATMRPLGASQA